MVHSESIRQILETYLSWMSPSLALAVAAALVAALVYAVVAVRPLKYLPCYWALALVGLAAGQRQRHRPCWAPRARRHCRPVAACRRAAVAKEWRCRP